MTLLDYMLIAVVLLSGFLGASRGLLRVLVAVICCSLAQLVTEILYEFAALYVELTPSYIAIGSAIFIAPLIVILVIAANISHKIFAPRIGAVDSTLGFLLGLPRGLLIFVVGYLFYAWLVPDRLQPEWVRHANSRTVLQATGDWLMSILPEGNENGFSALTSVVGLIIDGIVLSTVIDFAAVVTGWMGRRRTK